MSEYKNETPSTLVRDLLSINKMLADSLVERKAVGIEPAIVSQVNSLYIELSGLISIRRDLELDWSKEIKAEELPDLRERQVQVRAEKAEAKKKEDELRWRRLNQEHPERSGSSRLHREGKTEAERASGKIARHEVNQDKAREENQSHKKGPSGAKPDRGGKGKK